MALSACTPKALYIFTVYSRWSEPLAHAEAPAVSDISLFFSTVLVSHRFPQGCELLTLPSLGCGRKRGQSRVLSFALGLRPGGFPRCPAWRETTSPRVEPHASSVRVCSAFPWCLCCGGRDEAPCGIVSLPRRTRAAAGALRREDTTAAPLGRLLGDPEGIPSALFFGRSCPPSQGCETPAALPRVMGRGKGLEAAGPASRTGRLVGAAGAAGAAPLRHRHRPRLPAAPSRCREAPAGAAAGTGRILRSGGVAALLAGVPKLSRQTGEDGDPSAGGELGGARGHFVVRGSSRGVLRRGQFPAPVATAVAPAPAPPFPRQRGVWGPSRRPFLPEGRRSAAAGTGRSLPPIPPTREGSRERLQSPRKRSGSVEAGAAADPWVLVSPPANRILSVPRVLVRVRSRRLIGVGQLRAPVRPWEGQPGAAPACRGYPRVLGVSLVPRRRLRSPGRRGWQAARTQPGAGRWSRRAGRCPGCRHPVQPREGARGRDRAHSWHIPSWHPVTASHPGWSDVGGCGSVLPVGRGERFDPAGPAA